MERKLLDVKIPYDSSLSKYIITSNFTVFLLVEDFDVPHLPDFTSLQVLPTGTQGA